MVEGRGWKEVLEHDFREKRASNPRFTLRSYARSLSVSPGHLSQILSGKRAVKPASALKLGARLGLAPSETLALSTSSPYGPGARAPRHEPKRVLSTKEFSPIARWYYFAILGLANLSENVADPRWIAEELEIPVGEARRAFELLLENGYITKRGGGFIQATDALRTRDDVPAAAVRSYHQQNLAIASRKLDTVEVELREFASMTFPINPKRIATAKRLIRKFKEELLDELMVGRRSEVYTLCIQFFPVTKAGRGKR